jgi:hypothetical protein
MELTLSPLRRSLCVACLLVLLAASSPLPAIASAPPPVPPDPSPVLADPPRAPQPALRQALAPAQQALCASGSACVFLPAIMNILPLPASREYALDLYRTAYLGSAGVPPQWTGSIAGCKAGETSQAFRDSVLLRVNYFREMAGVPKITAFNDTYNKMDQAAALIMAANQELELDHAPTTAWACYSDLGKQGAGSSNLARGAYGPEAITLYMDDGEVGSLGHRRWVLYPQTQEMGTGDIPDTSDWRTMTNALKSWDDHVWDSRPATRDDFVAWPPAAYVPSPVVYPVWSFSVAGADFTNAAGTLTTGGANVPVTLMHTENGYGENTLAWKACNCTEWPKPGADQAYQVTVKGVKVGGVPRDYTYTVTIFDPGQ